MECKHAMKIIHKQIQKSVLVCPAGVKNSENQGSQLLRSVWNEIIFLSPTWITHNFFHCLSLAPFCFLLCVLLFLVVYGRMGTTCHIMGTIPSQIAHINSPQFLSWELLLLHLRNTLFTIKGSQDGNLVWEIAYVEWGCKIYLTHNVLWVGSTVKTYDSLDNLIVYGTVIIFEISVAT